MTSTLAIAPPLTPGANTVACTGAYQPEPKLVCKTPVTGWLRFNSYPLGRLAQAGATASVYDDAYFRESCARVVAGRDVMTRELIRLGFAVLPSSANFVFARHPARGGSEFGYSEASVIGATRDNPRHQVDSPRRPAAAFMP